MSSNFRFVDPSAVEVDGYTDGVCGRDPSAQKVFHPEQRWLYRRGYERGLDHAARLDTLVTTCGFVPLQRGRQ